MLRTSYTDNSQILGGALAGMSHEDSVIMFTNVGSKSCWVRGYPGVALLNSAGKQIHQAPRSAGSGAVPLIELRPGQQASAMLAGNSASCTSFPHIAGLLVTAPDQTTSVRLGSPSQPVCLDSVSISWLYAGNAGGSGV